MTKEKPTTKPLLDKKEVLGSEWFFTVTDEKIGEYINRIKTIESLIEASGVPKNIKETAREELLDILNILGDALKEREIIYDELKKLDNLNESQLRLKEEMKFIAGELEEIFKKYTSEDEEEADLLEESEKKDTVESEGVREVRLEVQEDTVPEVVTKDTVDEAKKSIDLVEDTVEEVSEEMKNYVYKPIAKQIQNYSSKIKKGVSNELKEEIALFIEEYTAKITYRTKILESDTVFDAVNEKELRGMKNAISSLEKLEEELKSSEVVKNEQVKPKKKKVVKDQKVNPKKNSDRNINQDNVDTLSQLTREQQHQIDMLTPGKYQERLDKMGWKIEESFEDEEFTSYESIVESIIENKNPYARSIFLDEHRFIVRDLLQQMESINKNDGPEAVNTFITNQQETITSLIKLLKEFGSLDEKENGLLINALRNDFDLLEEKRLRIKKQTIKNGNEVNKTATQDINLEDYLSRDRMEILNSNPSLKEKLYKALEDYKKAAAIDKDSEMTRLCLSDVHKMLNKFEAYEREVEKNTKKPSENKKREIEWVGYGLIDINNPEEPLYISYKDAIIMKSKEGFFTKVLNVINQHNENIKNKVYRDILDKSMEAIEQTITEFKEIKKEWQDKIDKNIQEEKDKKNKKGKKESAEPKSDHSETLPEPAKENEDDRIFYTEEGRDYHEISNDNKFDFWLHGIEKSILKSGGSIESEIKSLDDWYQEYQESLPYMEKLSQIFENIQEKAGNNNLKTIASKEKIMDLLYEIHTSGKAGKDKIDTIFKDYEESMALSQKRLELEKARDLAVKIKAERTRGEELKDLNAGQIKKILESKGKENTEKNIEEMVDFLEDMRDNYAKKYSNKNEKVTDDMSSVYSKYNFSKTKKAGGNFKKFLLSLPGSGLFVKEDPVDYQNVKDLIVKTRELNLVDRKTGNKDKTRENEARMEKLIAFTRGQTELLIEHVQNPNSNKAETLDEEEKEMLKLFDSMYKTFAQSKYRGREAREEAEELLSLNADLASELSSMDTPTDAIESLFDDGSDLEMFENEAKLQVAKKDLTKLKADLARFPKTGKNITEWTRISNKFTEIQIILETLGEDVGNDLDLKTARLQVEDLEIRHINKDVYKDLSKNFVKYESIINSTERTTEEKENYIKDLLDALKKHRLNKTNTKIQNGVLDDTIKKYEQVLKNIK